MSVNRALDSLQNQSMGGADRDTSRGCAAGLEWKVLVGLLATDHFGDGFLECGGRMYVLENWQVWTDKTQV